MANWTSSFNYIAMAILRHIPSKHLRIFILRKMGGGISRRVSMFASVDIRKPKRIIIEEGCSIGPHVLLDGRAGLTIRRNVTIAYGALIWTVHHDMNDPKFKTVGESVEIERLHVEVAAENVVGVVARLGVEQVVGYGGAEKAALRLDAHRCKLFLALLQVEANFVGYFNVQQLFNGFIICVLIDVN